MILSDKDIKRCIKKGEISIEPFNLENMTPNGYDLTINEIMIEGEIKEEAVIPPFTWFAILSLIHI